MTRSRQTADWGSRAGLAKVIPSSVAVGSGTGSADTTGKVTFSGASSVSLNGCFTTTYNSYLILSNYTVSASAELRLRVRTGGSDVTGANYSFHANAFTSTFDNQSSNTAQTSFYVAGFDTSYQGVMYLHNIALAENTRYQQNGIGAGRNGLFSTGVHEVATAYDSFTFYRSSGTMTGSVTVYGFN